jgi:arabinofuranan 3-O-arabinosyltransferase
LAHTITWGSEVIAVTKRAHSRFDALTSAGPRFRWSSDALWRSTPPVGWVSSLITTRRISAACGVAALLVLAFTNEGALRDSIAVVALVAISFAATLGWSELLIGRILSPRVSGRAENRSSAHWLSATIALVLVTGLAVQSWFRPGTTIASGDISPPDGMAWLARLFEPWVWTGSNLGEPSQLPLALPWAVVLGFVHMLGGEPELAQRIWYTMLFIGAGLGAFGLLATLRLGPVPALVGAAVYLLNPYVVSVVNINPVYIAALGLLAAIPAAILAAGTGRLSVRWGAVFIALAAPMFGYIDLNPPLVGMVLGAMLTAPLVAGWLDGPEAAFRSLRTLLLAAPLLLAASAYWIVPAVLHLSAVGTAQLVSVSSWSWTEARATIANAFWLNTTWAWSFPAYNPYAATYDLFPLSLLRYVLPAIAFSALALGPGHPRRRHGFLQRQRALRLAVAAATVAAIVVFLSTGTNPPGNLAFNTLYGLPYGWLLREPGRFLMVVSLTYSVLVAVVADTLRSHHALIGWNWWRRNLVSASRVSIAPVAVATVVCLGFPLYTGAVVADGAPRLAPTHVTVPTYWTEMARFVDTLPTQGAVLVMPPDDFYQMPYTWGYYGNDGFIVDLFHRPVLVPNGQGYTPASSEMLSAVGLTAQSILDRDWPQLEALVRVLNTPLILVRRDLDTSYAGRQILPAGDLADALSAAPNFDLVRTVGSLELFALRGATAETGTSMPVTINTQTPDLRLLSRLSPGMALVSTSARAGIPNVVQAPALQLWQDDGNRLVWQPTAPPGWTYRIAELDSKTLITLDHAGTYQAGRTQGRVVYVPSLSNSSVTVSMAERSTISNGDFAKGLWGPPADCNSLLGAQGQPYLHAAVIPGGAPGGLPALRLSASLDGACEIQAIDWRGGPLVLNLMVHPVEGLAPRVCLWEFGPQRCASLPSLPNGSDWTRYSASTTPDPGTTAISLYLYADSGGIQTVSEYADVRLVEVPALASFALLGTPQSQPVSSLQLVVLHNTVSTQWGATTGSHVVVDGMLNGWLVQSGSDPFVAAYLPAFTLTAARWISVLTLLTLLIAVVTPIWLRIGRRVLSRFYRSRLKP